MIKRKKQAKRIATAVSGGVDSLAAAFLLLREGHDVFGIHFTTGFEPEKNRDAISANTGDGPEPPFTANPAHMEALAERLGITVHTIDISKRFQSDVVDYFTGTYLKGETPNPCLVCNPRIKFGLLMEHALEMGADLLATGHYARIREGERPRLLKGRDPLKDQSYFLSFLTGRQLERACFPLGGITKEEVRKLARDEGLVPSDTGESQDICFIPGGDYASFLSSRPGFTGGPGPITTVSGKTIGEHPGLHRFTVGQRKGINCPAAEPYYVLRLETRENRLVVGFKNELFSRTCLVTGINWIAPPPQSPVKVWTRVRYRHKEAPSMLTPLGPDSASIVFDAPLSAVTPGQGAVFYSGDEVLGAGWISPS